MTTIKGVITLVYNQKYSMRLSHFHDAKHLIVQSNLCQETTCPNRLHHVIPKGNFMYKFKLELEDNQYD